MNDEARELVAKLGLAPLPHEGGFFRQTWSSREGSAILFLMTPADFSALHRMTQDEMWHFHAGDPVEHVCLVDGSAHVVRLGIEVRGGETPQLHVPRGTWQGARPRPGGRRGFSLVGCTVTPPWDDRGFELGAGAELRREFPDAAAWIAALTR